MCACVGHSQLVPVLPLCVFPALSQAVKLFGSQVLIVLKQLQDRDTMGNADVTGLKVSLETIRITAKVTDHIH